MLNMPTRKEMNGPQFTVHAQIAGKPALWLSAMKEAGFVTTNTDAVIQGIRLLYKEFIGLDGTDKSHSA
jgi:hypothetical protein